MYSCKRHWWTLNRNWLDLPPFYRTLWRKWWNFYSLFSLSIEIFNIFLFVSHFWFCCSSNYSRKALSLYDIGLMFITQGNHVTHFVLLLFSMLSRNYGLRCMIVQICWCYHLFCFSGNASLLWKMSELDREHVQLVDEK